MAKNHRYEEAIKDGIDIPKYGYWGDVPSKICGAYGSAVDGNIVKEAVGNYENKLAQKRNSNK